MNDILKVRLVAAYIARSMYKEMVRDVAPSFINVMNVQTGLQWTHLDAAVLSHLIDAVRTVVVGTVFSDICRTAEGRPEELLACVNNALVGARETITSMYIHEATVDRVDPRFKQKLLNIVAAKLVNIYTENEENAMTRIVEMTAGNLVEAEVADASMPAAAYDGENSVFVCGKEFAQVYWYPGPRDSNNVMMYVYADRAWRKLEEPVEDTVGLKEVMPAVVHNGYTWTSLADGEWHGSPRVGHMYASDASQLWQCVMDTERRAPLVYGGCTEQLAVAIDTLWQRDTDGRDTDAVLDAAALAMRSTNGEAVRKKMQDVANPLQLLLKQEQEIREQEQEIRMPENQPLTTHIKNMLLDARKYLANSSNEVYPQIVAETSALWARVCAAEVICRQDKQSGIDMSADRRDTLKEFWESYRDRVFPYLQRAEKDAYEGPSGIYALFRRIANVQERVADDANTVRQEGVPGVLEERVNDDTFVRECSTASMFGMFLHSVLQEGNLQIVHRYLQGEVALDEEGALELSLTENALEMIERVAENQHRIVDIGRMNDVPYLRAALANNPDVLLRGVGDSMRSVMATPQAHFGQTDMLDELDVPEELVLRQRATGHDVLWPLLAYALAVGTPAQNGPTLMSQWLTAMSSRNVLAGSVKDLLRVNDATNVVVSNLSGCGGLFLDRVGPYTPGFGPPFDLTPEVLDRKNRVMDIIRGVVESLGITSDEFLTFVIKNRQENALLEAINVAYMTLDRNPTDVCIAWSDGTFVNSINRIRMCNRMWRFWTTNLEEVNLADGAVQDIKDLLSGGTEDAAALLRAANYESMTSLLSALYTTKHGNSAGGRASAAFVAREISAQQKTNLSEVQEAESAAALHLSDSDATGRIGVLGELQQMAAGEADLQEIDEEMRTTIQNAVRSTDAVVRATAAVQARETLDRGHVRMLCDRTLDAVPHLISVRRAPLADVTSFAACEERRAVEAFATADVLRCRLTDEARERVNALGMTDALVVRGYMGCGPFAVRDALLHVFHSLVESALRSALDTGTVVDILNRMGMLSKKSVGHGDLLLAGNAGGGAPILDHSEVNWQKLGKKVAPMLQVEWIQKYTTYAKEIGQSEREYARDAAAAFGESLGNLLMQGIMDVSHAAAQVMADEVASKMTPMVNHACRCDLLDMDVGVAAEMMFHATDRIDPKNDVNKIALAAAVKHAQPTALPARGDDESIFEHKGVFRDLANCVERTVRNFLVEDKERPNVKVHMQLAEPLAGPFNKCEVVTNPSVPDVGTLSILLQAWDEPTGALGMFSVATRVQGEPQRGPPRASPMLEDTDEHDPQGGPSSAFPMWEGADEQEPQGGPSSASPMRKDTGKRDPQEGPSSALPMWEDTGEYDASQGYVVVEQRGVPRDNDWVRRHMIASETTEYAAHAREANHKGCIYGGYFFTTLDAARECVNEFDMGGRGTLARVEVFALGEGAWVRKGSVISRGHALDKWVLENQCVGNTNVSDDVDNGEFVYVRLDTEHPVICEWAGATQDVDQQLQRIATRLTIVDGQAGNVFPARIAVVLDDCLEGGLALV